MPLRKLSSTSSVGKRTLPPLGKANGVERSASPKKKLTPLSKSAGSGKKLKPLERASKDVVPPKIVAKSKLPKLPNVRNAPSKAGRHRYPPKLKVYRFYIQQQNNSETIREMLRQAAALRRGKSKKILAYDEPPWYVIDFLKPKGVARGTDPKGYPKEVAEQVCRELMQKHGPYCKSPF